jgi:hypothetical protein
LRIGDLTSIVGLVVNEGEATLRVEELYAILLVKGIETRYPVT